MKTFGDYVMGANEDKLNGLKEGMLVFNSNRRNEMFVVDSIVWEELKISGVEPCPYLVARQVVVDDTGLRVDSQTTHLSVQGSKPVTHTDVSNMMLREYARHQTRIAGYTDLDGMVK